MDQTSLFVIKIYQFIYLSSFNTKTELYLADEAQVYYSFTPCFLGFVDIE